MDMCSVHREWASRPADERFLSLNDMQRVAYALRERARERVVDTHSLVASADAGLIFVGQKSQGAALCHAGFSGMAREAGAPADYLRTLPAALAAQALSHSLANADGQVKLLIDVSPTKAMTLRGHTGPRYGRVWNADVVDALVRQFGDGVTGRYRVPGEYGQSVAVTQRNTTLYLGESSLFVCLVNEHDKADLANRRGGSTGGLSQGFIISNPEAEYGALMLAGFAFDYFCGNRMIWGLQGAEDLRMRHTSRAPQRWLEEVLPLLQKAQTWDSPMRAIADARGTRIREPLKELVKVPLLTKREASAALECFSKEEGGAPQNVWDLVTALTALAKGVPHMKERVRLEGIAGRLLNVQGSRQLALAHG